MSEKRTILMATMGMDIGGAETHIVELSKELNRRGYRVIVASNGGVYVPELEQAGIECVSVPMNRRSPWPMLQSLVKMRRLIKKERPDVVHAHARIPGFLCGILHKFMHFPFVTTAHWVFDTGGILGKLTNWGERTIAVSDDIKAYLWDNYGIPGEHVTVTINGIDTEKFSPAVSGAGVRRELNIPPDAVCVSSVSRLDDSRAFAARCLIDIAPQLAQRFPGLHLLIAGGGDVYDELKAKADAVNAQVGYEMLHLPGARTDINEIVAAGDVFVGVSRAALEAMAGGKAVIIAGNEGYHGIFGPEKLDEAMLGNFCCRGLPACTPEGLLADLTELLQSGPAVWAAQGAYNRQVIFDHYSVARMAEDALTAYRQVWRKKTAVISGYYGYHNLGDDAILLSIRRRLAALSDDVELVALSNAPDSTLAEYDVKAVQRFQPMQVRKAIKNADLLISGGGSLLQDRTSTRSLMYYLTVIRMALHYQKPVMLYANGIGPVSKSKNRRRVQAVVSKVDCITLRDTDSLQELEQMGVGSDAMTVTADPVFTLNGISPDAAREILTAAGIPTDRPILAVSMRQSGKIEQAVPELARFCDEAAKTHTVLFILMQTPADSAVTEQIRSRMSAPSYVLETPGKPETMMGVIGLCNLVFSMRLHTVIFAAKQRVPVMGLVYDPKVASYLDLLHMPAVGTPETFRADDALRTFTDLADHQAEYAARLDVIARNLEQAAQENDRQLAALLGL
mgnify:FL=1